MGTAGTDGCRHISQNNFLAGTFCKTFLIIFSVVGTQKSYLKNPLEKSTVYKNGYRQILRIKRTILSFIIVIWTITVLSGQETGTSLLYNSTKTGFPLGEFVRANKQKANMIGW